LNQILKIKNGVYDNKGEIMTDRENNLGVQVGHSIIHCNREFTIVDIRCDESSEGMMLYIHAVDPDYADREQRKHISVDQTWQQIMELVKRITEKGLGGMEMGGMGG
jgi:hypothetical protein